MAREDERAAVMARGPCGVPGRDGPCGKPRGRCEVHTEAWHLSREQRAIQTEDAASCLADRGRCGVVPRRGGNACDHPRTRCPHHAVEHERCQSTIDRDPNARCWSRRAEGSRYCKAHAGFPDFSVVAQRWIGERQGAGLPLPEEDFMIHVRAVYPDAAYELPRFHDFQKYVGHFANLGAAAERCS